MELKKKIYTLSNTIDGNIVHKKIQDTNTIIKTELSPSITSIEDGVFANCTSLTSIKMPGITSIGDGAFYGCTSLTSIKMPGITSIGGSAFANCTSLTSIEMPGITSIGSGAFANCTSLTSIEMPGITSIGGSAFYGCTSLINIGKISKVTSIGGSAFLGCPIENLTIPAECEIYENNLGNISQTFFGGHIKNLTLLTSKDLSNQSNDNDKLGISALGADNIYIPNVKTIKNGAFASSDIKNIDIPEVTTIESNAFNTRTSLKSIKMPKVTSIGGGAFYGCTNLESIGELLEVTEIDAGAFYNCTSLTGSISLPKLTKINTSGYYYYGTFANCTGITSVSIPNATIIGEFGNFGLFSGCSSLETVDISSATSIPFNTFRDCTSLKNLTIPVSVTSIESDVFYGDTLDTINYKGMKEQWNAITKDSNWNRKSYAGNKNVGTVIKYIICTDGTINL